MLKRAKRCLFILTLVIRILMYLVTSVPIILYFYAFMVSFIWILVDGSTVILESRKITGVHQFPGRAHRPLWQRHTTPPTRRGIITASSDKNHFLNFNLFEFLQKSDRPLFQLSAPDSDTYFLSRRYFDILCDKFTEWRGYTLQDIQLKSKVLNIQEQTSWSRWTGEQHEQKSNSALDADDSDLSHDSWVFLGYRGTSKRWAQKAADKHYQINANGQKWYGDGIYMTSDLDVTRYYTGWWPGAGRICLNFAPKHIMNQLLICGRISQTDQLLRQKQDQRPTEVSARFSHLDGGVTTIVYPAELLPFIKVMCISASHDRLPHLFDMMIPYFNAQTKEMELGTVLEGQ